MTFDECVDAYGDLYEDEIDDDDEVCPDCGGFKNPDFERCRYCERSSRMDECPDCDGMKRIDFERCRECQQAYDAKHTRKTLCPICKTPIQSAYLSGIFGDDERAYMLACAVTHYRHEHVRYYNNSVAYVVRFHDYDKLKRLANECAKRQIIRKAAKRLRAWGVTADDFAKLQGTTEETLALARAKLTKPIGKPCHRVQPRQSQSKSDSRFESGKGRA
jgi:hypothetical protein